MESDKFYELMLDIMQLDEFEDARYYALHLSKPLWNIFKGSLSSIPYFLRSLCNKTKYLLEKYGIGMVEILSYYAKDNCYKFVPILIKKIKPDSILPEADILVKMIQGEDVSDYIDIDEDKLICSIVCYVLDDNRIKSVDFNELSDLEKFHYNITDYKLTKVSGVKFLQSGYIYDNKYYLYSIFINKEKLRFHDDKPAIFRIIEEEISNGDVFMRLDERLAVPDTDVFSLDTFNFERFRGVQFKFDNTKLDNVKNIIVYGDPNTLHKLLMVIKKDYDNKLGEQFWHIEIEELPSIKDKDIDRITVTFVHGKYYPERKCFRHIDYIKNQYNYDIYIQKYMDMSNGEIKIDHYTADKVNHYKIWCVEETDIKEEVWYKLAMLSLHKDYRKLFDEMFGNCES